MIEWPNNKLEPVLITYNRAQHVRHTLEAFANAGLRSMRLHVLDNASTDQTRSVVEDYQSLWPNLHYHRNKYNVGGNANILRSVEIADSEYHWVIGDDDAWHLDDLTELVAVLTKGDADIIRLGWLVSPDRRGKYVDALELAKNEALFFASVSMISATILRRSLVTRYVAHAYFNIADSYPQLIPVVKGVEELPLTVYTLSRDIMTHTPSSEPGYFLADLEWYSGWFRSSRFFTEPKLRAKFNGEIIQYVTRENPTPWRQFFRLVRVAQKFKSFGISQGKYLLSMLAYGEGRRIQVSATLLLYVLTPKWIVDKLYRLYCQVFRKPPGHLSQEAIEARARRL